MHIKIIPVVYCTCLGAIMGFSLAYNTNGNMRLSLDQDPKKRRQYRLINYTISGAIIGFTASHYTGLCILYIGLICLLNLGAFQGIVLII